MKVLLTHPGSQHSLMLATELDKKKILHKFVTGIAFGGVQNSFFWKIATFFGVKKQAEKRMVIGVKSTKLYRIPADEIIALIRVKLGHDKDAIYYHRNKRFQQKIPTNLIREADIVIGFDTCSWILAERCKKLGKKFILDASIAHPLTRELVFEDLRKRYPLWKNETKPKQQLNIDTELLEMQLADHIVAATSFTQNTYIANGIVESKISINPYGNDFSFFTSKWSVPQTAVTPAIITYYFFGSIQARKGFPWLCNVWQIFHAKYPNTKLLAAGYGEPPAGFILPHGVALIGAVHPQNRTKYFHNADVFVFPSFFEGYARVIVEAMTCGLPVITTTNTAGPEVIENGKEGFVITPGDDGALFASMEHFVKDRQALEMMGRAARKRVEPLTWEAYGERWIDTLQHVAQLK